MGSTGSIGTQTLEVIDALNADATSQGSAKPFKVVGLSCHRHIDVLLEQARRYRPRHVVVTDEEIFAENRAAVRSAGADGAAGQEGLQALASHEDVDVVVHAVVGAAGIRASFAAAGAGKRICLANKESLVVGGTLLTDAAREGGATLLPIDSEHSAIFQALMCGRRDEIDRVLLTASGGPFRDIRQWPSERLHDATVEDALAHPTWNMGGKITVDSATMFNKALEIIEAVYLFDLPPEKIGVVVHPQSIVHSMVEFRDGSIMAQLSPPDMRTPIGYALTHPHRGRPGGRRMDWGQACDLHFEPPDIQRFPALRLAFEALAAGPLACVALNAANEVAVGRFLDRKLPLGRIAGVVEATMGEVVQPSPDPRLGSLDDLLAADAEARAVAEELAVP